MLRATAESMLDNITFFSVESRSRKQSRVSGERDRENDQEDSLNIVVASELHKRKISCEWIRKRRKVTSSLMNYLKAIRARNMEA